MAKHDLLKYFPHRFYSSQTGFRKPRHEVFQMVLERLGVLANEAVMVGDNLRMDIYGAQKSGLRCVFKRGIVNARRRVPRNVPILHKISELPEIISRWSN